eukprot:TRINITY_DN2941_c0_g1_i1.p1 TRINITY_DN2941_c0_g1~~TRINITY_DN2941_c0_g1_i1.p1  ORF type:complete len:342 (+),score=74.83 TRINITY_DN2941_c0_g1_i1:226-1251(+)
MDANSMPNRPCNSPRMMYSNTAEAMRPPRRPLPQHAAPRIERSSSLLQMLNINQQNNTWHGQELRPVVPNAVAKEIQERSQASRRRSSFLLQLGDCVCMSSTLEGNGSRPVEPAPFERRDPGRRRSSWIDEDGSPLPSRAGSRRGSVQLPMPRGASMHQFDRESLPMPQAQHNDHVDSNSRSESLEDSPKDIPAFFADDFEDDLLTDANLRSGNASPRFRGSMDRADNRSPMRRARRASREPTEQTILEQLNQLPQHTYRRLSDSPRSSVGSVSLSPTSANRLRRMDTEEDVRGHSPIPQRATKPAAQRPTSPSVNPGSAALAGLVAGSIATFVVMRQLTK